MHTSMNEDMGSKFRHALRSLLYGDIRLAMQIRPASANSFATSPEKSNTVRTLSSELLWWKLIIMQSDF